MDIKININNDTHSIGIGIVCIGKQYEICILYRSYNIVEYSNTNNILY